MNYTYLLAMRVTSRKINFQSYQSERYHNNDDLIESIFIYSDSLVGR